MRHLPRPIVVLAHAVVSAAVFLVVTTDTLAYERPYLHRGCLATCYA